LAKKQQPKPLLIEAFHNFINGGLRTKSNSHKTAAPFHNLNYANSQCSCNIEMTPPCKVQMALNRPSGLAEAVPDGDGVDEQSEGKSGGYRVIHYYSANDVPVFLLGLYSKGAQANLMKAQRNALAARWLQISSIRRSRAVFSVSFFVADITLFPNVRRVIILTLEKVRSRRSRTL
jgi:hypothetical protein